MGNEASKTLNPTEVHELKMQTTFSSQEIRNWYKRFIQDCPSGHMTQEQFQTMYESLFPKGDSRTFAEHVFKVYDRDRNGVIDFQEFLVTASVSSRGAIDEKLRWAFSMYDLDNNGYLTKQEVTEIFKSIIKMRGQLGTSAEVTLEDAVNQLFERLDRDGDDRLSDMEFILGAKASPAVLDLLEPDGAV